jgi:hypothetical protein
MTGGYVVNDAPDAGPGTPTHPGAGQDAAVGWLNRLKAVAQRMCVAPTTYAQADLDALQRVGDPGLSAIATKSAGDIVDQILGIASTRGATLIGDGPLTGPAVELLSAQGPTVAIGAANSAAEDSATGELATADVRPLRYTPQVAAAPFDPTVGAALAGAGIDPASPSYLIRRSTSRSNTTPRSPGAKTRSARCCGEACIPTLNRAARSCHRRWRGACNRRMRRRYSPRWPPPFTPGWPFRGRWPP